jgi:hypothetical protein
MVGAGMHHTSPIQRRIRMTNTVSSNTRLIDIWRPRIDSRDFTFHRRMISRIVEWFNFDDVYTENCTVAHLEVYRFASEKGWQYLDRSDPRSLEGKYIKDWYACAKTGFVSLYEREEAKGLQSCFNSFSIRQDFLCWLVSKPDHKNKALSSLYNSRSLITRAIKHVSENDSFTEGQIALLGGGSESIDWASYESSVTTLIETIEGEISQSLIEQETRRKRYLQSLLSMIQR